MRKLTALAAAGLIAIGLLLAAPAQAAQHRTTGTASTIHWSTCPSAVEQLPNETVRWAPRRLLSRGVIGATMIMIGAIGRNRRAALSGV